MDEIKVVTAGNIEGSIAEMLAKHKKIIIPRGVAMFFWESSTELKYWALARNATMKEHGHTGFLLEVFEP